MSAIISTVVFERAQRDLLEVSKFLVELQAQMAHRPTIERDSLC